MQVAADVRSASRRIVRMVTSNGDMTMPPKECIFFHFSGRGMDFVEQRHSGRKRCQKTLFGRVVSHMQIVGGDFLSSIVRGRLG